MPTASPARRFTTAQKDLADPAKVAASAGPIAAYVNAHVGVAGTDGKECGRGPPDVMPDGDGVIVRITFSCQDIRATSFIAPPC